MAFSATAPFLKKKAENPDNRAAVTAALRDVTGRRWRLSYELHDGLVSGDGEAPPSDQRGGVAEALHGGVRRRGDARRVGVGRRGEPVEHADGGDVCAGARRRTAREALTSDEKGA